MRAGEVKVTYEDLIQLLDLPLNTIILGVEQNNNDRIHGYFRVVFSNDSCPQVGNYNNIPEVTVVNGQVIY